MTEAELLFCEILCCDRPSLYLNKDRVLDRDKSLLLSSILKRRALGEPLPYILGKTEFMGLEFKVTPDVLIPRQETELLVEAAIALLRTQDSGLRTVNILEIGTGSGCIAVSLAKSLVNSRIIATDISEKALDIARYNSQLNGVNDRVSFIQSDLFSDYKLKPKTYDLIISNPPYVASNDIGNLQPEIRYEPGLALDGGYDGLDFYRRLITEAPRYLKDDGFLILEIGFDQAQEIKNLFQNSEDSEIIDSVKDYSKIDRVIIARRKGKYG